MSNNKKWQRDKGLLYGLLYGVYNNAELLQLIYKIVLTDREQTEREILYFCQYKDELY